MKRLALVCMVIALCATSFAQDWVLDDNGEARYNCDLLKSVVAAYGDQAFVRLDATELTVAAYFASTVPGCDTDSEAMAQAAAESYAVTVNDVINLRECGSTSCSRVGRAASGDVLEVVGEDGDWLEVKHDGATAFIAGWLTTRVVAEPEGLLADFQFNARSPAGELWAVMYGSTRRTGTHWLNLTRADGANTDIQVEAIIWETDDSSFFRPVFFGWGGNDWEYLPELIPDSSFYVYLPNDDEIYEFPVVGSVYASDYQLAFDMVSRPPSIRAGTPIRVVVADSGQADHIRDWMAAVTRSEIVAPPGRPQPPTLVAGDGAIAVNILPPAVGGAPITTYELRYREAGGDTIQLGNVNGEPYMLDGLRNGARYEVSLAAVSRGGKGPYSNWASITLES